MTTPSWELADDLVATRQAELRRRNGRARPEREPVTAASSAGGMRDDGQASTGTRRLSRSGGARDLSREATMERLRAACVWFAADFRINKHIERITETVMAARAATATKEVQP